MALDGVPKLKMDGKDPKPFANNVIFVLKQVVGACTAMAQQGSLMQF